MSSKSNTTSNSTTAQSPAQDSKEALNKFKYEVANEIGVPLKQGYNGDLTAAQSGQIGGNMVKKMVEAQEQQMSGK